MALLPEATAAKVADVEDYQVKLRLDDRILDSAGILTASARDYFGISSTVAQNAPESEQSVYVDTSDMFFADHGWSLRLRHKSGDNSYDLTYKYRQDIGDNSLSSESIDTALSDAKDNNFDSSDDNYKAQVNASYLSSTLDFSNRKTAPCTTTGCPIPAGPDVVEILDDALPGKLSTATGTDLADSGATASQVVTQRTWPVALTTSGTNGDHIDADLEITQMSGGYYVELTAETTKRKDAIHLRDELETSLDSAGLLQHKDAFKTGLILRGTL